MDVGRLLSFRRGTKVRYQAMRVPQHSCNRVRRQDVLADSLGTQLPACRCSRQYMKPQQPRRPGAAMMHVHVSCTDVMHADSAGVLLRAHPFLGSGSVRRHWQGASAWNLLCFASHQGLVAGGDFIGLYPAALGCHIATRLRSALLLAVPTHQGLVAQLHGAARI